MRQPRGVILFACLTSLAAISIFVAPAVAQRTFAVAPGGPSGLAASIAYTVTPGGLVPALGGSAAGLVEGDDIDGLSAPLSGDRFLLVFSVDPASEGGGGPIVDFPHEGHSFNVTDQATRGQAAGDAFLSTEAFSLAAGGQLPLAGLDLDASNNVLAVNQSAGFRFRFGVRPNIRPEGSLPPGVPADDVTALGTIAARAFASLSTGNPLGVSGADVLVDADARIATGAPGDEATYADAEDLGLLPSDDIDGLAVFDRDGDDTFDDDDAILLSLARESPSLETLAVGAADVLIVRAGAAPAVFATAEELGLLPTDNIDALDIAPLIGDAEETIRRSVEVITVACQGFEGYTPFFFDYLDFDASGDFRPLGAEVVLANVDDRGFPFTLSHDGADGKLAFSTTWINTRDGDGLSDGDFIGVSVDPGFAAVDAIPFTATLEGTRFFEFNDPDGMLRLRIADTDVAGLTDVALEIAFLVRNTGWEAGDNVSVTLLTDAGDVSVISLAGGDDGSDPATGMNAFNQANPLNFVELFTPVPPEATTAGVEVTFEADVNEESASVDNIRLTARPSFGPAPCNAADLGTPFAILNSTDINAFVAAFLAVGAAADLAAPFGIVNSTDINAFVANFLGGCP